MAKKWTKEYEREYMKEYRAKNKDRIKSLGRKWREANKDRRRALNRIERARLKAEVFRHYSGYAPKCALCGFSDMRALHIDHVNGDGADERRRLFGDRTRCGTVFYRWLRKSGYPKGYRVLCANCNYIEREPLYSDELYNKKFIPNGHRPSIQV